MIRTSCLIHSLTSLGLAQWHELLSYFLQKADRIAAFFPDAETLDAGKADFLALPGATTSQWEGMKGCLKVTAALTPEAQAFILRTLDEQQPLQFWSYQLTLGPEVLLRVEDFSLCLRFPTQVELADLARGGINVALLEPVSLAPALPSGVRLVPLTADEEEELRELLQGSELSDSEEPGP